MKTIFRTPHAVYCILLSAFCILNASVAYGQRLEVHAIKDFSTDGNAAKAWGVGGAIDLDQLVKNITFRVSFDWALFNEKEKPFHNLRYNRKSGGVATFYSFNINNNLLFQCGAEINYTQLKHSYVYEIDTISIHVKKTTEQVGYFIGLAPYIGFQYKLSARFKIALNFAPSYLILVKSKSSVKAIEPAYNKGVWLFPIRLGLSYQLFNKD